MNYNKKIDEIKSDEKSMINLVDIIHKTHKLYINQKTKDLDINTMEIPMILKLSKKEKIYQKDLIKKISPDNMFIAMEMKKLYDLELIERKIDDGKDYYICLTNKGKELALKIQTIEDEWEEMTYKNIETDDKEEFMKILKELAISSLKINQENDIKKHKKFSKKNIFDKIFDDGSDKFDKDNRFRKFPDFHDFHRMRNFAMMHNDESCCHDKNPHGNHGNNCKNDDALDKCGGNNRSRRSPDFHRMRNFAMMHNNESRCHNTNTQKEQGKCCKNEH